MARDALGVALEELLRRAIESDPLSVQAHTVLGWHLYYTRRYADAAAQLPKALELNPSFFLAHNLLGHCYLQMSRFDDAIAALQKAVTVSQRNPWVVASLSYACALSGRRGEAEQLVAELEQRSSREYVPAALLAYVLGALGQREKGLDCLERAYEARDVWTTILVDPVYDALRSHPRFAALLEKITLTPAS